MRFELLNGGLHGFDKVLRRMVGEPVELGGATNVAPTTVLAARKLGHCAILLHRTRRGCWAWK